MEATLSGQGERVARAWRDPEFAREWAAGDGMRDLLALPRAMAAAVVALENRLPHLIVDVGSGPGAFLAVFLERFPRALGVWFDASEAMQEQARRELRPFLERVEFRLGDMAGLASAGLPRDIDVIVTSRAVHHLDPAGIASFYREATAHLAPGGWLINLDHVGLQPDWQQRLSMVRTEFAPRNPSRATRHDHPAVLAGIDEHLRALAGAGIHDVDVPWRAFTTALFMGRVPSAAVRA